MTLPSLILFQLQSVHGGPFLQILDFWRDSILVITPEGRSLFHPNFV